MGVLENVSIHIQDSSTGTVTDGDGYFILVYEGQAPSIINLHFSMIGYEKRSISLNLTDKDNKIGTIKLAPEPLKLKPVHVHSHAEKSTQASDISLSGQALDNNRGSNLAMTLSNQPNIGTNSFGIVTSKPVLRGYTNKRYTITRDGNKIGDLSDSSIDHAIAFDVSEVNAIDIIRGPKSLIYGSKAIGGIINTTAIGSPKLRVERFYKSFLLGSESYNNGFHGTISLYLPLNNNQLNFSVNSRYSTNQTSPIGTLENSYAETSNYRVGFTRYNQNNYINFIFERFSMGYGIPPSSEGHISGVDIELLKDSFQINYHQDIVLNVFNQLDVNYSFIDYGHQEYENNKDYYAVSLLNKTHDMKVELKSSNIISGFNCSYREFIPGGFYWTPRTEELNLSVYNFYEKSVGSVDFLASVRAEHLSIIPDENIIFSNINNDEVQSKNFEALSSSLGLRKKLNKIIISSWIMNTMSAPRIEELYSDGPHLGTYSYEIGKPDLALEKIFGIESSIEYKGNNINLSVTGFYNYSPYYHQMTRAGNCDQEYVAGESHPCAGADFIEWGSGESGWLYKYETEGVRSLVRGMELSLGYGYKNFILKYNASLVHGNNLTDQIPLAYINPPKQVLALGYSKEQININARFTRGHEQNRLGEFETYTPSYFLIDLTSSYKIGGHNVSIQLNNIFDTEYYNHLSKIKSIAPEPGRNIAITYKLML